jgi:hemolysin activation/secretion protein
MLLSAVMRLLLLVLLGHTQHLYAESKEQLNDSQLIAEAEQDPDKLSVKKTEDAPSFNIYEYRVSGNTVLPTTKIEEIVYPFMGEGKNINVVEEARSALENLYHDSGYPTVFVNIPEQQVSGGLVKLEVVEGKVERLRVVNSHYYSLGAIKARVDELEEGKVPHFPTVQKQLATVNRSGDRQVVPVMKAGRTPGKVEVELKVTDKAPLHGNVELNDRYSANTTHTRLNGTIKYDNLWQQDHSLGISFQVTPEKPDETKVLSATYVIPRLNGDYVAVYGVISKSNISAVGDISVLGNGNIVGLRYIKPLPVLPDINSYFHTVTVGADYKDFQESTVLLGADTGIKTPISYIPFYAGYDGTLQGENSQTQFGVNSTFTLRGFGASEQQFANKRSLAHADFMTLHGDFKHMQKLPARWSTFVQLSGALSTGPLISNEQFAVGGVDSVRGYTESNSLGDSGAFGKFELRSPSVDKWFPSEVKEIYGFAFYDQAHVSILDPLPSQTASFNLASTGFGVRLKATHGIAVGVEFAEALKSAAKVKDGDIRAHFRINYEW